MTDRELLELAAKAAGIRVEWNSYHRKHATTDRCENGWWNPLTDDGDAFRLAVRLRMVVEVGGGATLVYMNDPGVAEDHGADPYAATRRAIVRAAAAMAKEKA